MTRVILKITVLMTRKKKLKQKMTSTKDWIFYIKMYYVIPKTNHSFPIV